MEEVDVDLIWGMMGEDEEAGRLFALIPAEPPRLRLDADAEASSAGIRAAEKAAEEGGDESAQIEAALRRYREELRLSGR